MSTENTAGPWDPAAQHGGPPSALLGRAIERLESPVDMQVARITFEILRPVPVARLEIAARVIRAGKTVQMAEAALSDNEGEVMRATAWRFRTEKLPLPAAGVSSPPIEFEQATETKPSFVPWPGYLHAMEWRFVAGDFAGPGPAAAWIRMRVPLLADEEPSPLTRVLAAADSASGISAVLDWDQWMFINTDLTVNLHRMPAGRWVGLFAETTIESHGIGLARSTIYDEAVAIGAGAQSLYVARRR